MMWNRRLPTLLVTACLAVASAAAVAQESPEPAVGTSVIDRFLAQGGGQAVRYQAVRRLTASNPRYNARAWLVARTTVDSDLRFRFEVIEEGGTSYIRRNVLRRALEREQAAYASGQLDRMALTSDNYVLSGPTSEDDGLLRIAITPRRREEMLIDGTLIVTSSDAELVRVEGRLARNPSFWTRRVDVVRRYARVNGVRVATELLSTAHLRIAGLSSFSMCYDYETINGEPVTDRTSCS